MKVSISRRFRRVAISAAAVGAGLTTLGLSTVPATAAVAATVTTSVDYTVSCNLGVLGTQTLSGTMTNTYVTPQVSGASFTSTSNGTLVVPAALVNAGIALGGSSFNGSVTTLTVKSSNATPTPLNVAKTPIRIPKTPAVENQPLTIKLPATGTITAGPWTAGTAGKNDVVTMGATRATIHLYNSSGGLLTTIKAICSPTAKTVLATVGVTS